MKAHFVPVAYLKGFAIGPYPRQALAFAVSRDKVFRTSVGNLCVRTDYYTRDPSEDDQLFREEETLFGSLLETTAGATLRSLEHLANQLWRLKLRNRAILDSTSYRQIVLEVGRRVELGPRVTRVIRIESAGLITSDDPMLLIGQGAPAEQCFLLPISPELLILSAPGGYFSITGSSATDADVALLNRWQCHQAREHVIMPREPTNAKVYQSYMRPEPTKAASGAQFYDRERRKGRVILNFTSINPRGPEGLPSFLTLRH